MRRYPDDIEPNETAEHLVAAYGAGARQIVADEIVAAIRSNDLARAKQWDRIGDEVDRRLAV